MSKELEALSRIEDCLYEDPYADRKDVSYENDIATIKQALLKQLGGSQYTNIFIDEAIKPSEALKELEQMREFGNHFWVADKVNKSYITIKEYILKAQEQEKEFDDKLIFKNGHIMSGFDYKGKSVVAMPSGEYSRLMEQKEVLEIIKKKDVNFEVFGAFETYEDYEIYYNNKFHLIENKLTQEEFDLLKRYFENE